MHKITLFTSNFCTSFELNLVLVRDIFLDQQTHPITRTVEETFYGCFTHCHVRSKPSYLMIILFKSNTYYGNVLKISIIQRYSSTLIVKII